MLSDEEKKALQYFNTETKTEAMHYGAVLVKLIEKQSKEIEELKEENENLLDALNNSIDIKKYWVSKDKIKAKIEELKQDEDFYREQDRMYEYEGKLNLLQSLLEKE